MTELEQIEKLISSAQEEIEIGKSLERLKDNKDFKSVFLTGYLRDFASELVAAKAQPGVFGTDAEKGVDAQINAVGHFLQFMNITLARASNAKGSLEYSEQERNSLMAEEQ